jgi:hypothetical protein
MGARQLINERPGLSAVVGGILCLASASLILLAQRDGSVRPPRQLFFTTDNGQTFFTDDATRLAPFTHDGREAVQANMFTCDGGRTRFVAYLQKYSEVYKKAVNNHSHNVSPDVMKKGMLVKRIDDKNWIPLNSPAARKMMQEIKCPDGTRNNLEQLFP